MAPKLTVNLREIKKEDLKRKKIKADILVINDLHLGAEFSKPQEALDVLHNVDFKRLVLGGDTFEKDDFENLNYMGEEVAQTIAQTGKTKDVFFVVGNHDEDIQISLLKKKLGLTKVHEYWQEGPFLVVHGHQEGGSFDEGSLMDWIGDTSDWVFRFMRLKNLHDTLGNFVFRLPRKVRENAIRYATRNKAFVVISGHTHRSEVVKVGSITYLNSGSFAGPHLGFITILGNKVTMYRLQ